jgi:hypothetical protein
MRPRATKSHDRDCVEPGSSSVRYRPVIHALPHVPKGYKLIAWPPSQVLKDLKSGQTVNVVAVKKGTKAQEIRRYKHLENKAGIVNLELRFSGKRPARTRRRRSSAFQRSRFSRSR